MESMPNKLGKSVTKTFRMKGGGESVQLFGDKIIYPLDLRSHTAFRYSGYHFTYIWNTCLNGSENDE